MLNYTVTAQATQASAGDQVDQSTPSVTLVITADAGYTVNSSDFSIGDTLPAEIDNVVFANSSPTTVVCVVTFASTFIMPASNVSLPIDIDGQAVLIDSTTLGSVEISGDNLNPNTSSTSYSITSGVGDTDIIAIQIDADAGYHFEAVPQVSFSSTQVPGDYTIFNTSTTVSGGKIVSYYFNVMYNRSLAGNVAGDEIRVVGTAVGTFVPSLKYYSYVVAENFGTLVTAGVYSTQPGDKQLTLAIYGDVGAEFTIDISKNGGATTNVVTSQAITFASGYAKPVISMPSASAGDYYDITLSGDIDSGFAQPNPIRINVLDHIVYSISVAPIAGYTITSGGITSVSGPQGFVIDADLISTSIKGFFKVTKDDGANIALQLFPTWGGNVTGLDEDTNGGTEVLYKKGITVLGNGTNELTISLSALITKFGNADVSSVLTLSTDLNATPVTSDITTSVSDGGSVSIPLTGNAVDADGDPLTPSIVTQPVNGTVVLNGFGFTYTHTANNTNPDQFSYQVVDGLGAVSNVSTVDISVAGSNPSGVTLEGGSGLYRMFIDVGTAASTTTITFNAKTKPARVQLQYNNSVVADSLFVGDNLTDSNRAATETQLIDEHPIYQFMYTTSIGNGSLYGQANYWNNSKPATALTWASTDIAPTGNVRTTQANWGGQLGVETAAGIDSADGNIVISYTKPAGGVTSAMLVIHGIVGSDWEVTDITVT